MLTQWFKEARFHTLDGSVCWNPAFWSHLLKKEVFFSVCLLLLRKPSTVGGLGGFLLDFPPLIFLNISNISNNGQQKRTVRDIIGFVRNVSIEIRFCFCRMILSFTATVAKLSNKYIHFLVMKRQETGDYRSTKGQNWYAFSELGRATSEHFCEEDVL